MSRENAEKFLALYGQHKAIAKRLAELDTKGEEALLDGLVKLAKDMGLEVTRKEICEAKNVVGILDEQSGGCGQGCTMGAGGWEFSRGVVAMR